MLPIITLQIGSCRERIHNRYRLSWIYISYISLIAGPRSAVDSASASRARGRGFDTRSDHLLSFLLLLIQEGQLSVTGEVCALSTGLPLRRSKPAAEQCG